MGRQLGLDTALGNPIANEQGEGTFTPGHLAQFRDLERAFSPELDFQVRADATPLYNCHGLAFASRRTVISDDTAIFLMLNEDGYREVDAASVLPGDLLIYFDEKGQPEHSAVVINAGRESRLVFVPLVVSKWGAYKEIIHRANRCPYSFAHAKYFRVQHD